MKKNLPKFAVGLCWTAFVILPSCSFAKTEPAHSCPAHAPTQSDSTAAQADVSDSTLSSSSSACSSPIPLEKQAFYYAQAHANYDKNMRRLKRDGPWEIFTVRIPADYLYAQVSAELFFRENPNLRPKDANQRVIPLEEAGEIVSRIREMQDLSPESQFQGNFRWYWPQEKVEDRNAVEFVLKRLLFCWAHREVLPEETHSPLRQIMRDAAPECLRRKVLPNYSNISVMNFANLILLGEALENPELTEEGIRRMNAFLFRTWRLGIHEFSTPTYFNEIFETLEQLENLTTLPEVRQKSRALLDYCAILTALHLTPEGRFTGACSRTYNYLYGDSYLAWHVGAWGWLPLPEDRSNITILAALNGRYLPKAADQFRSENFQNQKNTICERWGESLSQWKKTCRTPNFALGVSSAEYGSRQDQLWTLDLKKNGMDDANPRLFFIPDGRQDPWGTAREKTSGGHRKSLHLNPRWKAVQNGTKTRCTVLYPAELILKFRKENPDAKIYSTFVLKKPDEIQFASPEKVLARYGNFQLELNVRSLSEGRISTEFLTSPDGNSSAWQIVHLESSNQTNSVSDIELVFESEIHDLTNSPTQTDFDAPKGETNSPCPSPTQAPSNTFAPASAQSSPILAALENRFFLTPPEWEGPADILTLNGKGIGRQFWMNRLPSMEKYAQTQKRWISEFSRILADSSASDTSSAGTPPQKASIHPCFAVPPADLPKDFPILKLEPGESLRIPAKYAFAWNDFTDLESSSIFIQSETFFRFWVQTPCRCVLSARLLAPDKKHDSLQVTLWTGANPEEKHYPCWALDSSPNWRTVEFRAPDQRTTRVEFDLPQGPVLLRLAPREFNVQIQEIFLKNVSETPR